jgi:tRNA A37 threonylcarbamoyladenosine biosynthesis protein TsaE
MNLGRVPANYGGGKMQSASSPWMMLTNSSKAAIRTAFKFARSEGRSVTSRDMLLGVSKQHGLKSPVFELLRHFSILEQELYDLLGYKPETQSSVAFGDEEINLSSNETLFESSAFEPDVMQIIQSSIQLAAKYNTRDDPPLVRLTDLFGALLFEKSNAQSILYKLLSSTWATYEQISDSYLDFMVNPEVIELSEFLMQKLPPPSRVPQRVISGFGADTRSNRDLVGIGAEVDAFAYLITARALQPPLAIGLFGDWGSGKTYFMQSLQERVYKITEQARQSRKPQKSVSVYKYVVQIEFNAWHYVEGELWASLVEHIFNNLQTRKNDRPTLLEKRQLVWALKIEGNRRKQREIKERKSGLEQQLAEKQEKIKELQDQRDQKMREIAKWKPKDALIDVELTDDEKQKLLDMLNELGITGTYKTGLDFYNALAEMQAMLQEGNALGLVLRHRGWKWTARLVLVLFSGPVISGLVTLVSNNQVPAVTNALVGFSAFLSATTILLRRGTDELSTMLHRVKQAQAQLDAERIKVETDYAKKISSIKEEIVPIEHDYHKAQEDERKLIAEIIELEKEVSEITPRRVLLDFIKERVGSQDYRKWLGIPALIRRDFDQLSQLIIGLNDKFVQEDDGSFKQDDFDNINRIVLYIDDLDRCPPEKVAKVLQAVHLLLAFPLFVVVVAVDARWLSQSLQKYYRGLLAVSPSQAGTDMEDFAPSATPQDYLEKIFQVPFWVNSLSENARLGIVRGLVRDSLDNLNEVARQVGGDEINKPRADDQGGELQSLTTAEVGELPPVFYESDPKQPLSTTPPGLVIEHDEMYFMECLKPLLGLTPRSVRRFVNVYWLMKSMALAHPTVGNFVTKDKYADYQQVLFLLAVLTGLPNISHDFFRLLCNRALKGLDQAKCQHKDLAEVIDALQIIINERMQNKTDQTAVQRDLDRLIHWASNCDSGAWLKIKTDALSYWAPQIARFSYRMEYL